MKSFEIKNYSFDRNTVLGLGAENEQEENWPVVYQIYNNSEIYIGETTSLKNRMLQHLDNPARADLKSGKVNVVFDRTFNKSAALDLESYLIQYFSGDGKYKVLNKNDGMCDRDYYNQKNIAKYSKKFGNACANSK